MGLIIAREEDIATYIALCNFTHQGITNIKGSPDRINAARELAKTCGAELKELYFTMGHMILLLSLTPLMIVPA